LLPGERGALCGHHATATDDGLFHESVVGGQAAGKKAPSWVTRSLSEQRAAFFSSVGCRDSNRERQIYQMIRDGNVGCRSHNAEWRSGATFASVPLVNSEAVEERTPKSETAARSSEKRPRDWTR
jgi:hypothetical protein